MQAIAVFIDAKSINPQEIEDVYKTLADGLGQVKTTHIFGDWSDPKLDHWKPYIYQYAMTTVHQFNSRESVASTEVVLTIHAMDVLHSSKEKTKSIAIVSNHQDYAALALRFRASGFNVYGFGEQINSQAIFTLSQKVMIHCNQVRN